MPTRTLTPREISEARLVFHDQLDFGPIRIRETASWTNVVSRVHAWLQHTTPPTDVAITIGNHIFLPRRVQTATAGGLFSLSDMGWLMHELTHVWQYQHIGMHYALTALILQLRYGVDAYAYGGEVGLKQAKRMGKSLQDFNLEQQADIVRHYYLRLRSNQSTDAWAHVIDDMQSSRRA